MPQPTGDGVRAPRRRRAAEVTSPLETGAPRQERQAVGPSGIDGVPAAYDDGIQWLRNGARRHTGTVWLALIAGWTGVWISLWGALLGAFVGLLIAVGAITNPSVSNALFHLGIGQPVTALSVTSGIVLGAVGGFLVVLRTLFVYQSSATALSFLSGAVLVAVVVILIAAYERLGLRLRGYRRLSRDEVRRIAPLVKEVADAFELPALPRFAMADTIVPNAWTHMRTIVLTTGLLQAISDDTQLEAVLAHELHHWRSGDAVGLRVVWVAALPVALVYDVGMWLTGNRPTVPAPETIGITLPRGLIAVIGWIVAWPAWVLTKVVIAPALATSQRKYEYEADAAAASIGLGEPLVAALRVMGAFEAGRTGWERAMEATHPPTELRIEALQQAQPDDDEYQEGELRGPARGELLRLLIPLQRRDRARQ